MKPNYKFLFLLTLLVVLVFPLSANAQILLNMVTNVATMLRNVALALVIIAFIISAILFLIAGGEPGRIGTAKKMLYAGIAGTIIVIISTVAVNMIESALFQGQ